MGIGNTTPSSAIVAALTGTQPAAATGRGTGRSPAELACKIAVVQQALEVNQPDPGDPVDVLAKVGGFEIGVLAGLALGGAMMRRVVVLTRGLHLDGFMDSCDALFGGIAWLAFALLGLPGAFAYRALNTLDSMIGYHGKYEYTGKIAARLDDLVNLVPARLSALMLLAAGCCRWVDDAGDREAHAGKLSVRRGWRIMRNDHGVAESPNAGWTMSALSGLIGVVLEKRGHYVLGGDLRHPVAADIGTAVRLAYLVAGFGILLALLYSPARIRCCWIASPSGSATCCWNWVTMTMQKRKSWPAPVCFSIFTTERMQGGSLSATKSEWVLCRPPVWGEITATCWGG